MKPSRQVKQLAGQTDEAQDGGQSSVRPVDHADLDAVRDEFNGRPLPTLHWKSPSEALDKAVAITA
jgi:hypothetical protein